MATKDVLETMCATIDEHGLLCSDNAAVLMVSGGSDSTALAYLASELRDKGRIGPVAMLHVDHKLRGNDAKLDAEFASSLAKALDIPFFLLEIDIAAEAARTGENIEAVARRERYIAANDALLSLCDHTQTPYKEGRIVTAHTSDDRVENFYMRSIVGTGPGGFRSMLYQNGPVVRPLLDCTRESLRAYITELAELFECYDAGSKTGGISVVTDGDGKLWREDATNAHTDRFRAYVRHEIVPLTRKWNPQATSNLIRTMNLIADEDDMLDNMAAALIGEHTRPLAESTTDDNAPYCSHAQGFLLLPGFGKVPIPLQRRAVHTLLKEMLGADERIDTASVQKVMDAFNDPGCEDSLPKSGYVSNIQGNLAVSSNKRGVRVESMEDFRKRRKKNAKTG